MKKMMVAGLIAATLLPGLAKAQSARELYNDRQDIRDQRHDVRDARDRGAPRSTIRAERQDVRAAQQEYREDWRDYRRSHPDVYRNAPRWAAPRGYAYRPVAAGYRFAPAFYDRRYWIDPVRYRLRPTSAGQRWIRYGNDVVLIDLRSGRVIESNGSFFY